MFGSFFKRKTKPAALAPQAKDYRADYPGAVELARQHHEAKSAPTRWLEDKSVPPPTTAELDSLHGIEGRHKAELADAISGMSDMGRVRFETVYYTEHTRLMHASIEKSKANIGGEQMLALEKLRAAAQAILADHQAGNSQAPDIKEIISRGIAYGVRVASASDVAQARASRDGMREFRAWLDGKDIPDDLAHELYNVAADAGMDDYYTQLQVGTPTQPALPTWLPFLTKAPFGATRVHKLTFIAGRLGSGTGHMLANGQVLVPSGEFVFSLASVQSVELATQERVTKWSSALGWGIVGGVLLGPVGVAVGGVLGGQNDQTTFLITFSEEHSCLITARTSVYDRFLGATL
ncbi:hypothetical protein [Luteibacter sp. dw_328]|uniref:hypothetical protein n=1 Tax=Luteibacter sp. dw_328 TaxID=2719796 RepID=UPI001BD6CC05|nr:hypothetical protein [Luteibacter sp. dw_328]